MTSETKEIRMDIDLLVQYCGHFTDCETNNGYGCDHPKAEDGECHRKGCPVAWHDEEKGKDEMVLFNAELIKEWNEKHNV